MSRVRAADDFKAIRHRLEELRREGQQGHSGDQIAETPIREPDAVAHVPRHIVKRYFAESRRFSSR
jgi:hypothetical protein